MRSAAPSQGASQGFEQATYSRVTRRLLPFLFLSYTLAYIDRVNVGFAKLQMLQDLGMSDAVYGVSAGVFFLSYFLFEVPANMVLQRLGARFWLGPMMIVWGMLSASTMFVKSATGFHILRFVRGIVESGFSPGAILTFT